ncbi:carboxypeptidase regulatory-like domain-containing protein [Acidipila sp. EB88]|uniref:carboxypeptidase regulatory-like domain-containing protein n=1 Tax=Acidipila sp. EB88 TaxID=2305226 RepID=UPI000F5D85D1|nr:carboxypeptidase regulatory-like domain-containing protein [Acidipila sp. EB88]RRA49570.1 carboxypeptidase regulatory-like domain-containing protein [Acidipila sp. EB88]
MHRLLVRCFIVLVLCLGIAATSWAQFNSSLQGTVQDSSGASVPDAAVTLINTETKVSQASRADASGVYRFNSLAPGSYQVSATAAGFSAVTVAVTLTTGENENVPVTLHIGQTTTQVQVTEQQPLLDTSDTRNQLTLDRAAMSSLPLPARNPLSLITLTPGVTGIGAGNATNFNPENSVDASANGRGSNGNLYVVDGLDVTSSIRPGVVNLTPNADTVQEATVQTNTYTVDYGRASSIETLMTTRSGTNQFHGFASEFYTYQGLFARGEFGVPAGTDVSPYHTNNLSFGVGGPVIPKHQFFFFAGYEPYRAILSTGASLQTYEDPAFTAFANVVAPNSPTVALLNTYKPTNASFRNVLQTATQAFGAQNLAANTGCGTPSTDNIPCSTPVFDQGNFNNSSSNNSNQYNVRVDKTFAKDRVYGLFYRDTINTGAPSVRPAFAETDKYYTFSLQGNETHTFSSSTLNEAFAGYNRIEGFAPSTGLFNVPVVNVTGLGVGLGDGFALGDYVQHSYHWRDVLSHIHSAHDLRVGYEGWHGDDIANFAAAYAQPSLQYSNMIDLINNDIYSESGLTYDPVTGQPKAHNYGYQQTTGGAFAEDTWKASRKLTVNYGIRYDNFGNAYAKSGTTLANFHLGSGSSFPEQVANGVMTQQGHVYNHDLNWVFSPRGGFAYSPDEASKWLVHGGIGLYHDYFTLGNSENGLSGNPPSFVTPTFFNNGSTSAPIFSTGTQNTYPFGFQYPAFGGTPLNAKGGLAGSQIAVGGVDENLASPFTLNFSLAIDRQLTRDFVVSVGYVGSHSGNLVIGGGNTSNTAYGNDVNAYRGDLIQHINCTENATTNTCSGVQTRLNTSFGSINYAFNGAIGNYSGLVVSTRGRFARSGFLTASYTHSRSEDNWQVYPVAFPFYNFYAASPYDIPNRLSLGVSYELPTPRLANGFARHVANGWTLAGLTVLQSGQPFSVYTGAPFAAQEIDPAHGPAPANLAYLAGSGDFNADGNNNDYPNVTSYRQPHNRSAYLPKNGGLFGSCSGGVLPCGNFTLPAFGTEGNERPNQFRNAGYADTDITLKKNTQIWEGVSLELRIDTFNIFNRVNLVNSNSSVTTGAGLTTQPGLDTNLQDGGFGQSPSAYPARNLLLGARLTF